MKLCTTFSSTKCFSNECQLAALSGFKLSVQSVRQLQQHKIKVSFKITGFLYQWTPVANHSIHSFIHIRLKYWQQGSLQLGNVGWFWHGVAVMHLTW